MRRALALARRGEGFVEPNPMVGCVLVKGSKVLGEGYHHRYGGPHAEVEALRAAGRGAATGATAYLTLEPCCHQGKTPPCTEALIEAGVRRVVYAHEDPFEQVAGKGARRLRQAGIEVAQGLLEEEAAALMAPYLKLIRDGRPWVILKWAQSIDGKIATRSGDSKWISGPDSRRKVHRLRGRVDAIIVGVETVRVDDPLLTCREARTRRVAVRVVLDPKLRIPVSANLVKTAVQTPTLIVTAKGNAARPKARSLCRRGVELMEVKRRGSGLDLNRVLRTLGIRGMSNVMVEGGGRTLGRFMDAALADEAWVFVAPRLIGGEQAPGALAGSGPASMKQIRPLRHVERKRSGDDVFYRLLF